LEPNAAELCELLPWDSKFFGIRIARVRADVLTPESCGAIERWCGANEVRCLYFTARSDDARTVALAEAHGYHLADIRMTFERGFVSAGGSGQTGASSSPTIPSAKADPTNPSRRVRIRPATGDDLPELRRIARASHTDTRFFYDEHFPLERSLSLYETWIQASFEGFAQAVLVAEDAGRVCGFITCHRAKDAEAGSIGLIAVEAQRQGKGVGRALVEAAEAWLNDGKVKRVSVVTQGRNVAGQRLYARCGFIPRKLELYYHRWFLAVGAGTKRSDRQGASMTEFRIPFNRSSLAGREQEYIAQAMATGQIAGDQMFTKKCHELLERRLGVRKALVTTSCTHALEMAALLLNIKPGDEVIVPAFTFVSTVNAFVLRGAKPVFIDIRPDTLNLDETKLAGLITPRTKAVLPVHYAGVGCEMDALLAAAERHKFAVVEDNAHGLFGKYKGKMLGTFGCLATQSFHETKNITCGEGGALLINDPAFIERAEVIREKGTDRSRFFRGQVDKYSWVDIGSSYLMSDLLAAFLYGQLECAEQIQAKRRRVWEYYQENLVDWAAKLGARMPHIPEHCEQAYHMYYLLLPSLEVRQGLIQHLKQQGILSVFHYLPLHLSDMGRKFGGKVGDCPVTENVADRLLRLPFYNDLAEAEQATVVEALRGFNGLASRSRG
jgi:dTDP-4-amino-4,6-dideoxygalactose transaminase